MGIKASKYVAWLREQALLKRPYWYGTCGYSCSESLLGRKAKQYPSHYGSGRMSRYKADIAAGQICADCVGGAIKWAFWSDLGTHKNVYKSNGCPDTSADGMFRHCKNEGMAWGEIGTLPDKPGVAVRFSGHVGVYVGNGEVVEWRGFKYGCVVTKVGSRGWTHWYELPWVECGEADAEFDTSTNAPAMILGNRLLKRGSKGEDVRMLQEALNRLGFDSGEADGDFGPLTEAAVRNMQDAADIETDGKYGEKSHTALMGMLAEIEELPEAEQLPAVYEIRVTGGTVNIRSGPGTQFDVLTVVRKDQILAASTKADNGWYSVIVNGNTGWISGKYAEGVLSDD